MPITQQITDAFKPFLDANPSSSLIEKDGKILVSKPWGDESIAVEVPNDHAELADALNNLILPQRLSAIWHRDLRSIEVIYTAYRLPASQNDVANRKFTFTHKGIDHICRFEKSSDRLLTIAKFTHPQSVSGTIFRNLNSFTNYVGAPNEAARKMAGLGDPWSFWIENVDWDESSSIPMIEQLNFYLTYYDRQSPWVTIHEVSDEPKPTAPTRYVIGKFPTLIRARPINANLTSFYAAANSANPFLRFILYYRIIEYASHLHIETEVRRNLNTLLSEPHALSDIPACIDKITEVLGASGDKNQEIARFVGIVRKAVRPQPVWAEIKANGSFSSDINFDGGFVSPALISDKDTIQTFTNDKFERLCRNARKIRNALSHGRDQETLTIITPSTRNARRLRPWGDLLGTIAGEVMLYKDVN